MTVQPVLFSDLLKRDWERGYDDAIRGIGFNPPNPDPDLRLSYGSGYRQGQKEQTAA